jgi:hypothetical protein
MQATGNPLPLRGLEWAQSVLYRNPKWPSRPKHDESQTGHPGSNARPPSAPKKTAPDNHQSQNGRPVSERADITNPGLGSYDPRNQSKAQIPAPCQGGSAQNAKRTWDPPELAYVVGALEALIVHPRAFHPRPTRLSTPTTRPISPPTTFSLDTRTVRNLAEDAGKQSVSRIRSSRLTKISNLRRFIGPLPGRCRFRSKNDCHRSQQRSDNASRRSNPVVRPPGATLSTRPDPDTRSGTTAVPRIGSVAGR